MEPILDDLVDRFERGRLTRRQLVHALGVVLAAAGGEAIAAAQGAGLRGTGIDHVSVLVSDLPRSAAFYQNVFGMVPLSEDKPNRIFRLGLKRTLVSLRQDPPSGMVDHFAITVDNFNKEAVTQVLKSHGLTPQENIQFGFHIKDPDGVNVQIV